MSSEPSLCESNVEEPVQNCVAGQSLVINKQTHSIMEMMFSMERGGCAAAQENLDNPKQKPNPGEKGKNCNVDNTGGNLTDAEKKDENCPEVDTSKTGLAPWQEGVLDRLVQELTPQEYNMYVVHHGRMLLAFGQIEACTPREKDFVYGSLEPIPVQTVRSFKVQDS